MRQGAKKVSAQKPAASKAKASKPSAQTTKKPVAKKPQAAAASQPAQSQFRRSPYVGAIVADAATGRIIFSDSADRKAYPASVTKLMTALLVLEDVEQGKYKLTDRATASVRATFEQPSGVGIKPGQSMTIDDLLMSIMVKSANDAAVVLAEHAADGDLLKFIARMNARAKELGMTSTKYDSPNGLPPYDAKQRPKKWRHGYDSSTAADILKLAREVVKHRQIFKYTSTKLATVTDGAGQPLKAVNHNNILVKDKQKILNAKGESEVDGLKTGYIDAGGSSIALTGVRDGHRAIVVVLGSASTKERDQHARTLMVRALEAVAAPPKETAPPTAAVKDTPPPAQDAQPSPTATETAKAAEEAPNPAQDVAPPPAPASGGGSLALGLILIFVAGGVAAAAYFAWKWLGKGSREEWEFEDIPTESPSAPSTPTP
jgi:D-alanyl-D-alanine carboxypeptidase (penicillin-binding protein 5/6)